MDLTVIALLDSGGPEMRPLIQRLALELDTLAHRWEMVLVDRRTARDGVEAVVALALADARLSWMNDPGGAERGTALARAFARSRGTHVIVVEIPATDGVDAVRDVITALDQPAEPATPLPPDVVLWRPGPSAGTAAISVADRIQHRAAELAVRCPLPHGVLARGYRRALIGRLVAGRDPSTIELDLLDRALANGARVLEVVGGAEIDGDAPPTRWVSGSWPASPHALRHLCVLRPALVVAVACLALALAAATGIGAITLAYLEVGRSAIVHLVMPCELTALAGLQIAALTFLVDRRQRLTRSLAAQEAHARALEEAALDATTSPAALEPADAEPRSSVARPDLAPAREPEERREVAS